MDARLTVVTLGVTDLQRSLAFYRDGLGWPLSSASGGNVAFFHTRGAVLALYPRDLLAEDANLPSVGSGFGGITLAHNVSSRQQVDAALAAVEAAGGVILKRADETFWGGYSGYFADPDGFPWEVVWVPEFEITEHGALRLPE